MMWFMLACTPQEEQVTFVDAVYTPHDDLRLLRRYSLDIRGRLPSLDDHERVLSNPAQLDVILDEYLESEDFSERLVHILNEKWHTRVDLFSVVPDDFYTGDISSWYGFNRPVGEEPLRLMAQISVHFIGRTGHTPPFPNGTSEIQNF